MVVSMVAHSALSLVGQKADLSANLKAAYWAEHLADCWVQKKAAQLDEKKVVHWVKK